MRVQASTGERWLLDDHRHEFPKRYICFKRLDPAPPTLFTVILERDSRLPDSAQRLNQLDRARAALAEGRARSTGEGAAADALLAHLYVDAGLRGHFIESPVDTARSLGMAAPAFGRLGALDLTGLELASRSFDAKRRERTPRSGPAPS